MNNGICLWFVSGCTVAVVLCVALLPTTTADNDVSDERYDYCFQLVNESAHCPLENFSHISQMRYPGVGVQTIDNFFAKFVDSSIGLDGVCRETRKYNDCMGNMIAAAVKECGNDNLGSTYIYQGDNKENYDFQRLVKSAVEFCNSPFYGEMERYRCRNINYISKLAEKCAAATEGLFDECSAKLDFCKSVAKDVNEVFA
jgi:hypothetical protein